jgi:hypothetical protein
VDTRICRNRQFIAFQVELYPHCTPKNSCIRSFFAACVIFLPNPWKLFS